jgi:(R,R)-butanediol dehydrogenase / meso-butanediol dehydrogenase / diacetyl reductase
VRAARYHAVGDVRIEDVPEPMPGEGEVKIQVAYNGICGSDVHEYFDGPRAVPLEPHPLTGAQVPVILGHETAGYVSGLGRGVTGLSDGDLVVIDPVRACHACGACRAGRYNLCDRLAMHGYSTDGGGLAEYTVVPRHMVFSTPPGMTAEQAALIEPLAVAYHAVHRAPIEAGHCVAVVGGGPIGIGIVLSLRAEGIEDIVVVEPAPARRAVAEALGTRSVDPSAHDAAAQVRAATGGRGVDVAFETAGAATSFDTAVRAAATQGTVVVVASGRHRVEAPLAALLRSELTIRSTYASCGDFPAVIAQMATGAYSLDGWVSTIALDELVSGFERLRQGTCSKLLVDPSR